MRKNVFHVQVFFLFHCLIRVRVLKLNVIPHENLADEDLY